MMITTSLCATLLPFFLMYEVGTHQFITEIALDSSQGWAWYLENSGVNQQMLGEETNDVSLTSLLLVDFPGKAFEFAREDSTPKLYVEAGSILEDGGSLRSLAGHDAQYGFNQCAPRYFRHFMNPQENFDGFALRSSNYLNAREWGTLAADAPPYCGENRQQFSWPALNNHYFESLTGNREEKRRAQQLMLLGLGHTMHLVQDMTQPSHTRSDQHGNPVVGGDSGVEVWAGENFATGEKVDKRILEGVNRHQATDYQSSYADYLTAASLYSGMNFLSEDSTPARYLRPTPGLDVEVQQIEKQLVWDSTRFRYVQSEYRSRRRLLDSAPIDDRPTLGLIPITRGNSEENPSHVVIGAAEDAAADVCQNIIPYAVRQCEGVVDHFFRGRLSFQRTQEGFNGGIRNDSISYGGASVVLHDASSADSWFLGYVTADGGVRPFEAQLPSSNGPVHSGDFASIPGAFITSMIREEAICAQAPGLSDDVRMGGDREIIFAYKGRIGLDVGVAWGSTNFDAGGVGSTDPNFVTFGTDLEIFGPTFSVQSGDALTLGFESSTECASSLVLEEYTMSLRLRVLSPGLVPNCGGTPGPVSGVRFQTVVNGHVLHEGVSSSFGSYSYNGEFDGVAIGLQGLSLFDVEVRVMDTPSGLCPTLELDIIPPLIRTKIVHNP